MDPFVGDVLAVCGGIIGIILAANKARIDRIKAERQTSQQSPMPQPVMPPQSTVLTELREMKQKIEQMQSTSHQFDISFDAALSRLEGRVNRIETKTTGAPLKEETPQQVRLNQA